MTMRMGRGTLTALTIGMLACGSAAAGPPYMTDDPVPAEKGHWEVYSFAETDSVDEALEGDAGFDINYGAAEDLQLTLVLPVSFENEHGFNSRAGAAEVGVKYRLLHQDDYSWLPDVSFFPSVEAEMSKEERGPATYFLPLWLQKDIGPWSVFGGGGYEVNPGFGNRDAWSGGIGLSRALSEDASLGIEVYHHTPETTDGRASTTVNLGATYEFLPGHALLASVGSGLRDSGEAGDFHAFIALETDY
jgi:hypothetical protein